MNWSVSDGTFILALDAVYTTAAATILYVLGVSLRKRLAFLTRFCIPAPVIGGLIMASAALIMHHAGGGSIKFNTAMQSPMMIAFFTTVGIGGSLKLLKRGGLALLIYLVTCWGLAVFQNGFGVALATVLGLKPVLGVMAGAVSLEGGRGFWPYCGSAGRRGGGRSGDSLCDLRLDCRRTAGRPDSKLADNKK